MTGQTLGHYRVLEKIGAGGMGEVYRAADTGLNREVAIKVLPDLFARDAERLARFQREAQLLASLNHSNIGAIYGLEEAGGIRYLVLELVEGETLAERLKRGPLPIDEALAVCRQIAEALEAAHEKGVIHRDLKPSNVKVTPQGSVKVLDFGLAKALAGEAPGQIISDSPTLTTPATRQDVILGTAAYMSPEQARGRAVDRRTDIWAFGCMLYEMLTSRRAFSGETVSDTLAAVIRADPDWDALQADTPLKVRELLRRLLNKDPKQRLQAIGDARIEIEALSREPAAQIVPASQTHKASQWSRWWLAFALLAAGLGAGALMGAAVSLWLLFPNRSASKIQTPLLRTAIELPADAPLALGSHLTAIGYDSPVIALSPDGAYLTYLAKTASGAVVQLREMASGEIRPVPGTEGAIYSFFSPDGQWIGFLTNDKVKKVPLRGGAAITLCEARSPVLAWWPTGNFIYFTEDETWRITRVSIEGGRPEGVLEGSKVGVISFTDVLPDAKSVLGVSQAGIGGDYLDVVLVNLVTLQTRLLIRSGYGARYVPPGLLIFARAGNLMAVPFDPNRKEVTGEPVPVAAGAAMESLFYQVHASYSHNGLIAFAAGGDLSIGKLAWVDRNGKVDYLEPAPRLYGALELAPDGKKLAVHIADVADYVWIYDLVRREGRRLPGSDPNGWPLWSPDGRRISVSIPATGKKPGTLLLRDVEGGGEAAPPVNLPPGPSGAYSWAPKSNVLAVMNFDKTWHIGFLTLGKTEVSPGFDGWFPSFSPDGRWLAYSSNQKTGAYEVFIRSYPDGKLERQVSVEGGIEPRWKPSGELFYRKGGRWFSTRVTTEPELLWDPPRLAFETDFIETPGMSYDVSPDGQRLLVVKRAGQIPQSRIEIIANWFAVFQRGR